MSPSKHTLRLWLKLLATTGRIEKHVRARLRDDFATTLPRFDVLAMLDFAGDTGLNMGELSRRLMVSNGNVTGIVNHLVGEGLVERSPDPTDRRSHWVRLSAKGKSVFHDQAKAHEDWIAQLLQGLDESAITQLNEHLDRVRLSIDHHEGGTRP